MRTAIALLGCLALATSFPPAAAAAAATRCEGVICDASFLSIPQLYETHEGLVLRARVIRPVGTKPGSDENLYLVKVIRQYKGCPIVDTGFAIVETPCGKTLARGVHLLFAKRDPSGFPLPLYSIGACHSERKWSLVLRDGNSVQYLEARRQEQVCKGVCLNGKPLVRCLAEPCSVSVCTIRSLFCVSNYCGGCNTNYYRQGLFGAYSNEC